MGISKIFHISQDKRYASYAEKILEHKRVSILNSGVKSFYYIDAGQIKDMYYHISDGFYPSRIERREHHSTKTSVNASLKMISSSLGSGNSSDLTETYKGEINPTIMYYKLEKHLVENNEISLGLEDDYTVERVSKDINVALETMRSKYHSIVPNEILEKIEENEKHVAAYLKIYQIRQATGYVVLKTEFEVEKISNEGVELRYRHPLNNTYIIKPELQFLLACVNSNLTPSGKELFKPCFPIKLTCLGKIFGWNNIQNALLINPIAIY